MIHRERQFVALSPEELERSERLRAAGPTRHCGDFVCMLTLPDPDAWQNALRSHPEYDPECCCPCLACHPSHVPYDTALRAAFELYGRDCATELGRDRAAVIEIAMRDAS